MRVENFALEQRANASKSLYSAAKLGSVARACGPKSRTSDATGLGNRAARPMGEAESMKTKRVDLTPLFRKVTRRSLQMPALAAVCVLAVTNVTAQTAQKHPTPSQHEKKRHVAAGIKSPEPQPEVPLIAPPPPPPAPPLTLEQMPPQRPQITWDGQQLTIISQNSTLSDILREVGRLTGAAFDMPPNGSRERVAAQLGPGPAREILSALLSGTEFDYVIQASETDPAAIRSMLLTLRDKGDGAASKNGSSMVAENTARSPYGRNARATPTTEGTPAPETTASVQPEDPVEPRAPSGQASAAATQSAVVPTAQPAVETPSATTASLQTTEPELVPSAATSQANTVQSPLSESEQRVQQMQNMFEQRKQMMEEARKPPAN